MGEGRLLQIQPTQVSDSGRYLCVATNVAGEDDQDFTVLIQGACAQGGRQGVLESRATAGPKPGFPHAQQGRVEEAQGQGCSSPHPIPRSQDSARNGRV